MTKLSAVIITLNEERNIERCLKSLLSVADEIIVVDSFSTDRTSEISRVYGAKFICNAFEGHIQQKNFALGLAQYDLVLSLDADEALDPILLQSIKNIKLRPTHTGYTMNRKTNYCGRWINHCGWYPDVKLRLVKKGSAEWRGINPHDCLTLKEASESMHLTGDILHYSFYTKEDHFRQIEYFGNIASNELFRLGKRVGLFHQIAKVCAQFIKTLIIKLGFLDGLSGVKIAIRSSYATNYKYNRLRKLWRESGS